MGGKGGKGKGKGKHWKKDKRKRNDDGEAGEAGDGEVKRARNDIWQEESTWELANADYETYYSRQRVCSEEEWPVLLQHLRSGLPVSIRVNRMRAGAESLCERLAEMKAACEGDAARPLCAPRSLTWYPHNLGWQWLGLERRTVKKDKANKALKDFLCKRERSGLISRQEVVSMIPPLFLGVEPHHLVLDLCAAPGSKTSQMLEMMHWPSCAESAGSPSGFVVANELQWKRANMLAHQVQRLGSPCAVVLNMDAQFFPEIWVSEDGVQKQLRYDRILADVPCSGDGTMRKTPYIWKSWTLKDGLSLHIRQLGILMRGLELLKVGGRIVYSTCSLNPMEDESVVAAVLARHGDSLRLVPPPELPGFKAAKCLEKWEVPDPEGEGFYSDYETLAQEKKEGKNKLLPSMFPPKDSAQVLSDVRDHCRRMLPHLMDTGGFFVAIIEKKAELKPSSKARREADKQARKTAAASSADAANPAEPAETAADAATSAEPAEAASAAAEPPKDVAMDEAAPAEAKTMPQGLRRITKEYVQVDDATWSDLSEFYGIDASLGKRFCIRVEGDSKKQIFLLSQGVEKLVYAESKLPTRMVLCGVAAFQVANSYQEGACKWAPAAAGLPALVAVGMKRQVSASRQMMSRILREKEVSIGELREAATKGEIQGLDALAAVQGSNVLRPGNLAVLLRPEGGAGRAPFVVLATLTDSMLELQVTSGGEMAALLEDLEGQPPVEEILRTNEPNEDEGADADVEATENGGEEVPTDRDADKNQADVSAETQA